MRKLFNYYTYCESSIIYIISLLMINILLILYYIVFVLNPSTIFFLISSLSFLVLVILYIKNNNRGLHIIGLSTPIPTLVVNKKHIVTHFNKACEELTGTPAKDVIGYKNVFLAYSETDSPTVALRIIDEYSKEEILEEFKDLNLKYVNEGYEGEFFTSRIGNNEKWIQFRAAAIRNKRNKIIGAIVTFIDITKQKLTERHILESKDLYYKLINFAPNAFIVHTSNEILFSNIQSAQLLGFSSQEDLTRHKLEEFILPRDYKKIKIYIPSIIKQKRTTSSFRRKIIIKDGSIIDVKIKSAYFKYNGIDALITTLDNVSEHLQMKNELRLQKEYFKNLFEGSPLAIVMIDNKNKIVNINNSFKELFQYNKSEVLQKQICQFIIPDHLRGENCSACQCTSDGKIKYLETTAKRKDNVLIDVSVVWCPIAINNKHIGTYGIYRDITEHNQTQIELANSEERYRQLVELLPLGVVVHKNNCILYVNKAAEKIMGATENDNLIGMAVMDRIHPKFRETVASRVEKLLNNEDIGLEEEIFLKLDGTPIDVEVSGILIEDIDVPVILTVFKDISERKRAEELQRKFEYEKNKLDFFANLSHELRTPLNVIFSTTQLLTLYLNNNLITDSDNRITKRVDSLKQNSFRLLRIVNNLIDITRIDSGFYKVSLQNYDIIKFVEEIILSVSDYIQNNGIKFEFTSTINSKIIACDINIIERVILNLISNAIKFTNRGGIIKVSIYKENNNIIISIKDSGIGIKKEYIKTIFDRFVQVNKSLTRPHEGSGIGLYLVKSLIDMHGGNIRVESVYNEGSNFIIELPIKVLENEDNNIRLIDTSLNEEYINNINIEFSDIYSK